MKEETFTSRGVGNYLVVKSVCHLQYIRQRPSKFCNTFANLHVESYVELNENASQFKLGCMLWPTNIIL